MNTIIKRSHQTALFVLGFTLGGFSTQTLADESWSYTYNSLGLQESADGPRTDISDVTTYTYDAAGNRTSMTNAQGQQVQYLDFDSRGNPGRMIDANGIETIMTYHPRGWLATSTLKHPTDSNLDAVTQYSYNPVNGLVTQTQMPDGSVLSYEYDDANRLVAIANNLGERIDYTLDNAGNRIQESTSKNGIVTQQISRNFDELSRLMDTLGNDGQVSHQDYDLNGNNVLSTDGNSHTTAQDYDSLDRVSRITQADSSEIEFVYDDQDRILAVIDPRGVTTSYTYDAYDNVLSEFSPDRGTIHYEYDDANNRTTQYRDRDLNPPLNLFIANIGAEQTLEITGEDNQTAEATSLGNTGVQDAVVSIDTFTLDEDTLKFEVEVLKNTTNDPSAYLSVLFTDDTIQGPSAGIVIVPYSGQIFDLNGGQIFTAQPIDAGLTIALYLKADGTAWMRDSNGNYSLLNINPAFNNSNPLRMCIKLSAGALVGQELDVQFNSGSREYYFKDANKETYTYDALNRLTSVTFNDDSTHPENIHYGYDYTAADSRGAGRLTSYADQSGSTQLKYNYLGLVSEKTYTINGQSYTQTWEYDPAGNLIAETYPLGRVVEYTRDPIGRVIQIDTKRDANAIPQTLVSNVTYQPFGGVKSYTYGNGVYVDYTYDLDGRVSNIDASGMAPVQAKIYSYDLANNITAIDDFVNSEFDQTFELDSLNRIIQETGHYGGKNYTYDVSSNRTSVLSRADGTFPSSGAAFRRLFGMITSYQASSNGNNNTDQEQSFLTLEYEVDSNRLAETQPDGFVSTDAEGNITGMAVGENLTRYYAYNNQSRLSAFWQSGDTVKRKTYLYNALGQRVYDNDKHGSDHDLHYSQSGQYLGRYTYSDAAVLNQTKEWIYLAGMPIAQIEQHVGGQGTQEAILYVHNDHLSTPRLMTDSSQDIVWRWDSDAFGVGGITKGLLKDTNGNEISDTAGNPIQASNPLRFPGQIEDDESGIYYNYYRDYDPKLGRYIQSDPIGLFGGLNTYGYVGSNPLVYSDPYGLFRNPSDIFDEALNDPQSSSGTHGAGNAYQHCFASCMLAAENTSPFAQAAGFVFEEFNDLHGQTEDQRNMDDANNATGRAFGEMCVANNAENISQSCSILCTNAMQNGGLTTLE